MKIPCKICNKEFKRVCSHVRQTHDITAREYKKMFGYDVSKGILTDEDRLHMREIVYKNNIPEIIQKAGAKTRFKNNQEGLGLYKRSKQTMERLVKWGKLLPHKKGRTLLPITCIVCNKVKDVNPAYAKTAKYCSRHCAMLDRSKKGNGNG